MQEENNNSTTEKVTQSEPEVVQPTVSTNSGINAKDLLVPVSVVIAGVFIGGGLYFGGSSGTGSPAKAIATETGDPILNLAIAAGADEDDFTKCFQAGETLSEVDEDTQNAVATGGQGTPWGILIGPGGKKYPINGAVPQQAVEQLIATAKSEATAGPGQTEAELALENINPVTADDNIKGNLDAEIMIIEYSDFDCPFCSRFHATMNSIAAKYSGDEVAWVYRHFPLEQLHPNAKAVAVASECVAKLEGNEAFWSFADGYLSN